MRERDRQAFRAMVARLRAQGLSLTAAVQAAYAWLLQPSKKVWPR